MSTTKELTEGAPLPLILNFTFPLLLGNILQQTYSLIDAVIVGRFLGINDLAAIGASTSVVFLILGFCNGCCSGFGIPVAQKFGARDYDPLPVFGLMKNNAEIPGLKSQDIEERPGLQQYKDKGWWNASEHLEYSTPDFAIAQCTDDTGEQVVEKGARHADECHQ